jgi:c-di-GMP-binding flagellar brake protein YcgR
LAEQFEGIISQKIQVLKAGMGEWFNSSIQDISRGVISIAWPYLQERPLVLRRGDIVEVRLASKNATYSFKTSVIGEKTDNIKLYQLAYPKEVQRIQQRLHVRLPVILDARYAVREDDKKPLKFVTASTVDLSGGGLKLAVREKIKEHTKLYLEFNLPLRKKPELLKLEALVIRSQLVDLDRAVYHLGLKFMNINRKQEDMIVRFIFERMAQQKRLL